MPEGGQRQHHVTGRTHVIGRDVGELLAGHVTPSDEHEGKVFAEKCCQVVLTEMTSEKNAAVGQLELVDAIGENAALGARRDSAEKQQIVAALGGRLFDAEQEGKVEIALIHGEDRLEGEDAEHPVTPALEIARRGVHRVAELGGCLQHRSALLLGDVRDRRCAVDDHRHGRLRHTGPAGDVHLGWSPSLRCHSPSSLTPIRIEQVGRRCYARISRPVKGSWASAGDIRAGVISASTGTQRAGRARSQING